MMMKQNNHAIEERLARWKTFVEGGKGSFMFHVNCPMPEADVKLPLRPQPWPDMAKERIERRWGEYELLCRKAALIDDDRVPYLGNCTGTEIFAEAFGCKVHRPDNDMPFALPLIQSAAEADKIKTPELSTSSLAYLFDIADELYRRGGPGAVMQPVDIQSPMDIVALIWEKEDLFCAMIETPDAVKSLAGKVRELLVAFMDEWIGRYGTTIAAHYPEYILHGGISISVDEVGAVNAEIFQEFFRDELECLADHFGGIGIHCCADARHQWGNFRALRGLKVINHNAPPTRNKDEYLLDAIRFYHNIVSMPEPGWAPGGDSMNWPAQIPDGARVVFDISAEDVTSAAAMADRLQEARELLRAAR